MRYGRRDQTLNPFKRLRIIIISMPYTHTHANYSHNTLLTAVHFYHGEYTTYVLCMCSRFSTSFLPSMSWIRVACLP